MKTVREASVDGLKASTLRYIRGRLLWASKNRWFERFSWLLNNGATSRASFFHSAVCRNQGDLVQYRYMLSQKHRDLKEEIRSSEDIISDTTVRLAAEVASFAHKGFFDAVEDNFKLLSEYFAGREGGQPRMCIKGNFKNGERSAVVSVFRDQKVGYDSSYDIEENTGFLHCFRTGQHYLENDLVSAAAKGKYRNPRLRADLVRAVMSSSLIARFSTLDANWTKVWSGLGRQERDCYRSTLIVPMTLWNNRLSAEFVERFGASNSGRLIFGFLCFDSPHKDYFIPDDVDVGYIFADLLSLYAFDMLTHTEYSKTVNRVMESVSGMKSKYELTEHFLKGEGDNSAIDPVNDVKSIQQTAIKTDDNNLVYWDNLEFGAKLDEEVE